MENRKFKKEQPKQNKNNHESTKNHETFKQF